MAYNEHHDELGLSWSTFVIVLMISLLFNIRESVFGKLKIIYEHVVMKFWANLGSRLFLIPFRLLDNLNCTFECFVPGHTHSCRQTTTQQALISDLQRRVASTTGTIDALTEGWQLATAESDNLRLQSVKDVEKIAALKQELEETDTKLYESQKAQATSLWDRDEPLACGHYFHESEIPMSKERMFTDLCSTQAKYEREKRDRSVVKERLGLYENEDGVNLVSGQKKVWIEMADLDMLRKHNRSLAASNKELRGQVQELERERKLSKSHHAKLEKDLRKSNNDMGSVIAENEKVHSMNWKERKNLIAKHKDLQSQMKELKTRVQEHTNPIHNVGTQTDQENHEPSKITTVIQSKASTRTDNSSNDFIHTSPQIHHQAIQVAYQDGSSQTSTADMTARPCVQVDATTQTVITTTPSVQVHNSTQTDITNQRVASHTRWNTNTQREGPPLELMLSMKEKELNDLKAKLRRSDESVKILRTRNSELEKTKMQGPPLELRLSMKDKELNDLNAKLRRADESVKTLRSRNSELEKAKMQLQTKLNRQRALSTPPTPPTSIATSSHANSPPNDMKIEDTPKTMHTPEVVAPESNSQFFQPISDNSHARIAVETPSTFVTPAQLPDNIDPQLYSCPSTAELNYIIPSQEVESAQTEAQGFTYSPDENLAIGPIDFLHIDFTVDPELLSYPIIEESDDLIQAQEVESAQTEAQSSTLSPHENVDVGPIDIPATDFTVDRELLSYPAIEEPNNIMPPHKVESAQTELPMFNPSPHENLAVSAIEFPATSFTVDTKFPNGLTLPNPPPTTGLNNDKAFTEDDFMQLDVEPGILSSTANFESSSTASYDTGATCDPFTNVTATADSSFNVIDPALLPPTIEVDASTAKISATRPQNPLKSAVGSRTRRPASKPKTPHDTCLVIKKKPTPARRISTTPPRSTKFVAGDEIQNLFALAQQKTASRKSPPRPRQRWFTPAAAPSPMGTDGDVPMMDS